MTVTWAVLVRSHFFCGKSPAWIHPLVVRVIYGSLPLLPENFNLDESIPIYSSHFRLKPGDQWWLMPLEDTLIILRLVLTVNLCLFFHATKYYHSFFFFNLIQKWYQICKSTTYFWYCFHIVQHQKLLLICQSFILYFNFVRLAFFVLPNSREMLTLSE